MIQIYKKVQPEKVEAVQFTGNNQSEIVSFVGNDGDVRWSSERIVIVYEHASYCDYVYNGGYVVKETYPDGNVYIYGYNEQDFKRSYYIPVEETISAVKEKVREFKSIDPEFAKVIDENFDELIAK